MDLQQNATHADGTTDLRPTPVGSANTPMRRMAAMPMRARVMLALGTLMLVGIVVALLAWNRQGDWRVLYANLADKDAGAVVAQLSQMNIPYRHADGGQAILIPADKVHDVRLKLAQAGLPKGSVAGFELMDSARFGQTQFQERLTFQRGLEGELVRSIGSLSAVQSARVHLALPQQNGFFREQQKPRASVLVTLHTGRTLDRAQIAGIVHLVSSSVPELNPKAVSVLDQSGTLLSGQHDEGTAQGLEAQQLQYAQHIEAGYMKRLVEILEPMVGRNNVRASVSADIDFAQSESTSEAFKPNQGTEPAAVRSMQSSESSGPSSAQPSGVPGAASNQPPVPATAPIAGASAPLRAAGLGTTGGGARRDSVTNYEVDKTVRVTRQATGTVKRLNAAIIVNHRSVTDDKGVTTNVALSKEDIEKITALAQEAMGFNKDRGDSVKVINTEFHADAVIKPEPLPIWQQPWVMDWVRTGAVPLVLGVVALLVIFGVIRPALKPPPPPPASNAATAAPGGQINTSVGDPVALPGAAGATGTGGQGDGRDVELKLAEARNLARQNPQVVAGIVRDWSNGAPA